MFLLFWCSGILTDNQTLDDFDEMCLKFWCSGILTDNQTRIIDRTPQATITAGIDVRSIRLDVKVETIDKKIIDVEMQVGHYLQLPLRFRGYQSILDASYWKRGDNFDTLKETYIIFLCLNDPFSQGNPVYTFEPICKENCLVEADFKTHWIALNAQAANKAPMSIQHLLKYMKTNMSSDDALIQKIDEIVVETNNDSKKVIELTTIQDKIDEFRNIIEKQHEEIKTKNRELESAKKEIENLKKQLALSHQ